VKRLGTKELEETIASLRQLRDRFSEADAGSAARQIAVTIREAEAELASRRKGSAGAGGTVTAFIATLSGNLAEFAPLLAI
jgi:hypothetical protein